MVLCDIGNTTYHFKIDKDDFKVAVDSKNLPKVDEKIYFISVNDNATKRFRKYYKNSINLKDVVNFSTKYKGIGIDRVVASSKIKDGIIVDVGSAITVDIMKDSIHRGGFILPGFNSYKEIYPNISEKLSFEFTKKIDLDKIPLDTNSAINYAIYSSIVEPIKKLQKKYKLKVILTGGDGELLLPYIKWSIYKKNLIFKNMKKIIKENRC